MCIGLKKGGIVMNGKRMFAIVLAAAMSMGLGLSADATEAGNDASNSLGEVIAEVEDGYSEYYDILDTAVVLCYSHKNDKYIENIYLLEMEVMLKAQSVSQLDYYQGIMHYCESVYDAAAGLEENRYINQLNIEQMRIYEELEGYIGKKQDMAFYIKETYPESNPDGKTYLIENGEEYVSINEIMPRSHEELHYNGFSRISNADIQNRQRLETKGVELPENSYSVALAVDYMKKYTSNPSSCNACGNSECGQRVDTTKYNSKYTNYASSHSDCANYVSQALSAGGLPTDSTWRAGSNAWIGVTSLINYMTSNGYWNSVNYTNVGLGDILSFSSGSHVVMITSFDGTTYKYSGHTNDRLNYPISIGSGTGSFYRVSYGN